MNSPQTKTLLRIMKLTTVIMFIFCFQLSARVSSQSITYTARNASLETIFKVIKKQTGYSVFWNKEILSGDHKVSIEAKDMPLENFLDEILKTDKLTYNIEGKVISVRKIQSTQGLNPGLNPKGFSPGSFSLSAPPVTGFVRGLDGQPIAGANVIVKGTKYGTITNIDGSFSIEANKGDKIIVSSVGFIEKQLMINNNDVGVVTLVLSESKLDEVHVIAYGTTSKRLSTSSITGITSQDIKTQPVNNPLLTLAGRATGVTVTQASGLAGSAVTLKIQGQNSIDKGNDPFFVVDGVPYSANLLPTLSNVLGTGGSPGTASSLDVGTGNPFTYINPSDIESIEVLKDADATAIYGSRAANGAVLITTKKGKAGKTNIDVTAQAGFGKVAHKLDLLNTQQYLMMRKEAYTNDNVEIPTPSLPIDEKRQDNYDLTVWDQNRYTDWQKELLGGSSQYTDIQTGLSGGTNQTTFRINGGYHRETTVFPGNHDDVKASLGLNLNHASSNQQFKIQFSANYLTDKNQLPAIDLTNKALILSPNAPALYHSDGTLNWETIETNAVSQERVSTFVNPLGEFLNDYQIKGNNLISNLNLSYKVWKGLTLKTTGGYSILNTKEYGTGKLIALAPELRSTRLRGGSYSNGEVKNWIIEPQVDYQTKLISGRFEVLCGATIQQTSNDLQQFSGEGYNSDLVIKSILAASTVTRRGGLSSEYKYNAIFGRFNYNLNDKYIINITARRDGSSRFGPKNQFHNFGAIGAAWIFSNEEWLKKKFSSLSYGKLRSSYGTTGNDQIGDYNFLSLYNILSSQITYGGSSGIQVTQHSNPYLQWEETKKFQAGLDLGFIRDKILFTVNYFKNRSSNQLITYVLPDITGFPGITKNFPATVENQGWEFSLNTTNIENKAFKWSSLFNITIPENKLVDFPDLASSSYANRMIVGKPVNIFKIYSFSGVNPQTGIYNFNSAKGTVIPNPSTLTDRILIFNPNPKFYGGLQNIFSYSGFDFSFLLQFTRQDAQSFRLGVAPFVGTNANAPVEVLNRWQQPGDQAEFQKFTMNTTLTRAKSSNFIYEDASYIRLKNASLSWNMPVRWIKNIKIDHVRLFVQGQNILTLTNYLGLDPENTSSISLPPLRVVTFGAQILL
jgi:TonB-dependent starch-binding outer membrane protein SusC